MIDVGYAGVIGAQRIAAGQVPYGHFPVSNASVCGPARFAREPAGTDPAERAVRGAEAARRHVRPGRLRGVPTRLRALRLGRAVGRPSRCSLHRRRLRYGVSRPAVPGRAAVSAAHASARRLRSRGRRIRSRSTHWPRPRTTCSLRRFLLAGLCSPSRCLRRGGAARPLGLDEVRGASARPVVGLVSGRAGQGRAPRRCSRWGSRPQRAPRSACCSSTPICTRSRPSTTARSATSSAARRPSRSGTGASFTPAGSPTCTGSSVSWRYCWPRARSPSTSCRAGSRSYSSRR